MGRVVGDHDLPFPPVLTTRLQVIGARLQLTPQSWQRSRLISLKISDGTGLKMKLNRNGGCSEHQSFESRDLLRRSNMTLTRLWKTWSLLCEDSGQTLIVPEQSWEGYGTNSKILDCRSSSR